MAHKTLIGGTAYEIGGGKALISGTAYEIAGGRTLISGTGYDISFGAALSSFWIYSENAYPAIPLTEYYFEDGMTWGDFIASSYNTNGIFTGSSTISYNTWYRVMIDDGTHTYPKTTDVIVSGGVYKAQA